MMEGEDQNVEGLCGQH